MKPVKQNGLKAWILAARPKTLAGAAAPVLIGASYAALMMPEPLSDGKAWVPALLCLVFALLMQIDANFINDYFDFKKGTDRADRLGPERACAQGWVTGKAMKTAIFIVSVLACCVGLPLVVYGGWWLVAVGAVCVLGAFLYTTKLSYKGLGDVCVIVFFGLVPVFFTYYVTAYDSAARTALSLVYPLLLGLATGFVIDTLLLINNYRDRYQDALSGKNTIVVRYGGKFGLAMYALAGCLGAAIVCVTLGLFRSPWGVLEAIYLIFHFLTFKKMTCTDGRALNVLLGETSRNIIIFAVVTCAALILSR